MCSLSSALTGLILHLGAGAQEVRLGSEFQVNTYTTNYQVLPAVAADADGDFIVAWHSLAQEGSQGFGVFAQRFSSAGAALASEFQVSSYTTSSQTFPAVAADADGDFIVAWHTDGQDGSSFGVFARRFSSAGAPLASEFQVNSYTIAGQAGAQVAAEANGDFVVAWISAGQDGWGDGVFARRFSSAGAALASEFQVNSYTMVDQRPPALAADADGDFVVAWHSFQDGSNSGIFARRFSSSGGPLASEFQVNSYTSSTQLLPAVAADADGDFVVAWMSVGQDGSSAGVFARRFSSSGAPLAAEFRVNSYVASNQDDAAVAADSDGDFVIAWESETQDGSLAGVFARRFSSSGAPLAIEFQVNSHTESNQGSPAVARDADGNFVVVWHQFTPYGSNFGVFAQRFSSGVTAPTATATVTPTATETPTSTPTPTSTSAPVTLLYEIPTLSNGALAILALVLSTVCLAFLSRGRSGRR